jgi:hypothetical protein
MIDQNWDPESGRIRLRREDAQQLERVLSAYWRAAHDHKQQAPSPESVLELRRTERILNLVRNLMTERGWV